MKLKNGLWLVLACLLALGMVLASCQPAVQQPTGGQTVTGKVTGQTTAAPTTAQPKASPSPTTPTASTDAPKYGGVLNVGIAVDILGFDEAFTSHWLVYTLTLTNEELLSHDWSKGPGGTNQADYMLGGINRLDLKAGVIAESWEIPTKGTIIFRIRKGINWHNKAPVNGRELNAEDVVYSLKRVCTEPRSYIKVSYPAMAAGAEITAPDKWTVVIKTPLAEFGNMLTLLPDFASIIPKEVVDKYTDMRDWKVSVGTGPFMLTDFVSGSSASLVKNPGYWGKDPVGPGKGNQLPYLDGVKFLVIPDQSTRYTALRTAKIDWVPGVLWDDAASIRKTNPDITYRRYLLDSTVVLYMRLDKPELPFKDKRVRQALAMGIDQQMLKNVYYGGEAEILSWPIINTKEYKNAFVPYEQLPQAVKDLYTYNPDKAKKLLAEAGFPSGFKTKVQVYNTPPYIDVLSQVKAMWAKIGVELQIEPLDYAVITSLAARRAYDEMMYAGNSGIGTYFKMINFNGPSQFNGSYVDDAKVKEAYTKAQDLAGIDEKGQDDLHRELMPYVLEQAWVLTRPAPYTYVFWHQWLKGHNGEIFTGYYNVYAFPKFAWLDLGLRMKMIGR
ncbi:MAG: ABC transporter substrate-binding protein [Dehalococcoidia bacterium]|nr:ABC transporter substrate-binding protein [Dehalococcoidia bacterium]